MDHQQKIDDEVSQKEADRDRSEDDGEIAFVVIAEFLEKQFHESPKL